MNAAEIAEILNKILDIDSFKDVSNNGLQVANSGGEVQKIVTGVDASQEFFEHAVGVGADLVICHHGISWGDSLKKITGLNYKNLKILLDNDIALYAAHLPLDAHPKYGNNARIAQVLNLTDIRPFGEYHGNTIGFSGELPEAMEFKKFLELVKNNISPDLQTMNFGPESVKTVAIISGGAASDVVQAGEAGFDVYLSGEPALVAYSPAREFGIHAVFAGHYRTEIFGVKALAEFLRKEYNLNAEFLNLNIKF